MICLKLFSVHMSVRRSVGRSVRDHESKSVKTCISAPAHPSAAGMAVYPALLHYSPCTTVRDCLAVYPALFFIFVQISKEIEIKFTEKEARLYYHHMREHPLYHDIITHVISGILRSLFCRL